MMISERELRNEYRQVKRHYRKQRRRLDQASRKRNINALEREMMELHDLRVTISTIEWVLGLDSEECYLPI